MLSFEVIYIAVESILGKDYNLGKGLQFGERTTRPIKSIFMCFYN